MNAFVNIADSNRQRKQGSLPRSFPGGRGRSGVALVFVLAIVAVSMALAYSLLRSQVSEVQISSNHRTRGDARAAARAGMSIALGRMHRTGWAGADTTLSGNLSAYDRYSVTYTTGDSSLLTTDSNYWLYPYRVTLLATGYSRDPSSGVEASYKIRTVVQLVPRAMAAEPTDWATAQNFTVFQRVATEGTVVDVPMRVLGPARLQGTMQLFRGLPWGDGPRQNYLSDLNWMRNNGHPDYRPFNGPIHTQNSTLSADNRQTLDTYLAVPRVDLANASYNDWSGSAPTSTYRLYPGGKQYSVESIPENVPASAVLAPNMLTNPLGIRQRAGDIRLASNVNIQGMLVAPTTSGRVRIEGQNVQLSPATIPPLDGTTQTIRIPTVVTGDDFRVDSGASGAVTGFVNVKDDFEIDQGPQARTFGITGRVVLGEFNVDPRNEGMAYNWNGLLSDYLLAQLLNPLLKYPIWCKTLHNIEYIPPITIVPDSVSVTYHWFDASSTLFVPHASEPGLRWDVIAWQDGV
jgi:hypothetical protein